MATACFCTCGSALPRTVVWKTSSTPTSAADTTTIRTMISISVKPRAALRTHIARLVLHAELQRRIAGYGDDERRRGGRAGGVAIAAEAVELEGHRADRDPAGHRHAERDFAGGSGHAVAGDAGARGAVAQARLARLDAHEDRAALRHGDLARVLHLRKEAVVEAAG